VRANTNFIIIISACFLSLKVNGQTQIAFVSDTQAPMWIEKVFLKSNRNELATSVVMASIAKQKPTQLFILGDVVALGYKDKKWNAMDSYVRVCRDSGIQVSALLGNHDVMSRAKKGEEKFQQRFPDHVRTGYVKIIDSIAVVLLNSNFKKLSKEDIQFQQNWLLATLKKLDLDPSVLTIITTCHHAPFSNSKIVGSSKPVQTYFVPLFFQSTKCQLFITGHSHAFELFKKEGKQFLIVGGGGGIHQPLNTSTPDMNDLATDYKPMFHYATLKRTNHMLHIMSQYLTEDFSSLKEGYSFTVAIP
jgi:UDP-2,3-diacylglucosamine pyrophosphatase LpxH